MSLGERPFLTVGRGLDPTPIDAVADDVLLGRRRAPVAERQVVFVGPALVAMAADPNPQARVSLEDRHLLIQAPAAPARMIPFSMAKRIIVATDGLTGRVSPTLGGRGETGGAQAETQAP